MADHGLFIGWSDPARGRERKAIEVFNEAVAFYAELERRGEIESFEAVLLEPHGGDLNGFFLLRGERDKLARLRWSDEFTRLNTRAALVVDGFGVVGAALGGRIPERMAAYEEAVADLA